MQNGGCGSDIKSNDVNSHYGFLYMAGVRLPVGISDFKELVGGNYIFADKTLLIKEVIEDGAGVILIPRPRRFGKTLNLSMLYYYLKQNGEEDENLFEGLKISEDGEFCEEHQGKYPVIFITFKDIKAADFDNAYGSIVELMRELYAEHRYLLEGNLLAQDEKGIFEAILYKKADLTEIKTAIKQLSVYMARKFGKPVVILIDEYDTPIQEAYLREYYGKMVDLMRGVLGQALKDNRALGKAVITGITRISQESLFSGLNNISVYSLLREKYGQYFGFVEEEVRELVDESKETVELRSIKEWYNGYEAGKYVLYNPWSIINCLSNDGKLQPYWVNTASNALIDRLLSNAGSLVKKQFEELLQGNVIEQPLSESLVFLDIEKSEEALWSLLLYAGYLKVLSYELQGYKFVAKIAVPNKEVSFVYDRIVDGWFSMAISSDSYGRFVQSLANGDVARFKEYLSSYIMQSGSYFDFSRNTEEQIFHVFVLGLVVGLRDHYVIHSNEESGLGRCDVMFMPKERMRKGILLEFKTSEREELLVEKAKEALKQVKEKGYMEGFKQQGVEKVLAIGVGFCGKKVEVVHEELSS